MTDPILDLIELEPDTRSYSFWESKSTHSLLQSTFKDLSSIQTLSRPTGPRKRPRVDDRLDDRDNITTTQHHTHTHATQHNPTMDIDVPNEPSFPDPTSPIGSSPGSDSSSYPGSLQLPGFSASFPLPFRVLTLVGFAILLWAINLHVLSILGVDTVSAFGIKHQVGEEEEDLQDGLGISLNHLSSSYPDEDEEEDEDDQNRQQHDQLHPRLIILNTPLLSMTRSPRATSSSLYKPVYFLFLCYTTWVGSGWVFFRWITGGEIESMERWRGVVAVVALGAGVGIVVPWNGVGRKERRALAG